MKNIAVVGKGFFDWGGGKDFIYWLISGLLAQKAQENYSIYLFLPEKYKTKEKLANNFIYVTYFRNRVDFFRKLQQFKIDLILPTFDCLQKDFPIPSVGYIPDLQHKYYPDFFSPEEIKKRDQSFETILKESNAIIVASKCAKNDLNKFYPNHNCKIFNLPFAPFIDENCLKPIDFKMIAEKYKLPQEYLLISSQFWIHKDHLTAFKALEKLKREYGKTMHIVCTGTQSDHRFPDYFSKIQSEVKNLNLEKNILFLGYIPKNDQIQILRHATALIQPTLFEGGPGGGSVYSAVSLGIRSIISDIPINKEIENNLVTFFQAKSPEDLAAKINQVMLQEPPVSNNETLLEKSNKNKEFLGDCLREIINSSLQNEKISYIFAKAFSNHYKNKLKREINKIIHKFDI